MWASFTAMKFLKTLFRALGTYKSPLSFHFKTLTALYTNCDCLYLILAASLIVPTVDHLEPGIQSLLLFFGVCRCDLMLLHCPRVCCSSPCVVECSCCRTFPLLCMEGIVLSCTVFRQSCCVYFVYGPSR